MVFEDLGFRSFYAAPGPVFAMHRAAAVLGAGSAAARTGAGVVVDCGFSFTHAVPFFKGLVGGGWGGVGGEGGGGVEGCMTEGDAGVGLRVWWG